MKNLRTYCVDVANKVGINAAVLLNQIIYWQGKSKNKDKSFYKLDAEWQTELGLSSVYAVRRAKKRLIDNGYIDVVYKLHNNKRTTVIYLMVAGVVKDFPDMFTDVQTSNKDVKPTKNIKSEVKNSKGATKHNNTQQINPVATVSDDLVQSGTKVHGDTNIAVTSLQTHIEGVPVSVIETPLISQIKDNLFKRVKPTLVESSEVIHDRILAMRKALEAKSSKIELTKLSLNGLHK